MSLNKLLLKELKQEAESTRKLLAVVPDEQLGWKPHEKSMTAGRLASHIAELPHWMNRILEADGFDMAANPYGPFLTQTNEELLEHFETKLVGAIALLEHTTDEHLFSPWTLRRGDHVISNGTRYEAIRSWLYNHQLHHRGQLSVYLRLLDVAIPGMYGPSADDIIARQKAAEAKA